MRGWCSRSIPVPETAVDLISEHGYEPQYGARPLRRVIRREVDDQIADPLATGALADGDGVTVDAVAGALVATDDSAAPAEPLHPRTHCGAAPATRWVPLQLVASAGARAGAEATIMRGTARRARSAGRGRGAGVCGGKRGDCAGRRNLLRSQRRTGGPRTPREGVSVADHRLLGCQLPR
ncbi:hypothetical protein B7R22_08325 [Subtercola boreus]|uniref:Clp ATPase C-terminal domain-containing protein n=1 Tax=Subtercola boreus TaxID=120213 RepID=A0A3E0VZF2_9MICO|nr:hypothetical protein B7R22_08325 [Subtercola boreus]